MIYAPRTAALKILLIIAVSSINLGIKDLDQLRFINVEIIINIFFKVRCPRIYVCYHILLLLKITLPYQAPNLNIKRTLKTIQKEDSIRMLKLFT